MTHALPYDVIPNQHFFPLCCTKSGDIVGTDDGRGLVKYDKNRQFLEHHCYTNDDFRCQVTLYIQSDCFHSLVMVTTSKLKMMTLTRSMRRPVRISSAVPLNKKPGAGEKSVAGSKPSAVEKSVATHLWSLPPVIG
ncbi:hypothetical protein RYX36_017627 [Vicia faba]